MPERFGGVGHRGNALKNRYGSGALKGGTQNA